MNKRFAAFADKLTHWFGSVWAITFALLSILLWGLAGPIAHWSDTWQLVANTTTTLITYVMVFVIQSTMNRDSKAIHAKLDALIEHSGASNELERIEDLPEDEIEQARKKPKAKPKRKR